MAKPEKSQGLEGQVTALVELHVEAVETYVDAVTKSVKKLDEKLWAKEDGLGVVLLKPWTALLTASITAMKKVSDDS